MSNSPLEAQDDQHVQALKGDSLERNLERIDLNASQSKTESPESSNKKLSARDLLARLSSKRLDITEIKFTENSSLGRGGHGEVVVATLVLKDAGPSEAEKLVAVKKLQFSDDSEEEKFLRGFVNELRIVERLRHPNIVEIMGFVENIQERITWLIFRWEANGNLREFLRSGTWDIPERVSLIQDVASGLEYLHGRDPPICHGDLKSLNILVNADHRAVITDFGSARILRRPRDLRADQSLDQTVVVSRDPPGNDECPEVTLSVSGTELTLTAPSWSLRWAAPEILNDEDPGLASDIWALGWVAWEAVTDNYPFPEAKNKQVVTINVILGRLPSIYKDSQLSQIQELCHVMVKCWKLEPKERPSAVECRDALGWIPSVVPLPRDEGNSKIRSAPLLLETGEIHHLHGRHEEALRSFEEGSAIARSTGDAQVTAAALRMCATVHRERYSYKKAEELFNQAMEIFRSIGDELGQANTFWGLGNLHHSRSDYVKAEECFIESLAINKSIGSTLGQANALDALGQIHRMRSDYDKAEGSYSEALSIYNSIGNDRGRANILFNLGGIHRVRFKYDRAEESYKEALTIYTSMGSDLARANVLNGLGEVHQAQNKYDEAKECYTEALAIYTRNNDDFGRANVLCGLAGMHYSCQEYAQAEESYAQAAEVYGRIGNHWGQANALLGLGTIHQASSYTKAEKHYRRAMAIYTNIGHDFGRANALRKLGEIHGIQSNYYTAREYFAEALAIYTRLGSDEPTRANVACALGAVHQMRVNYAEAQEYYTQAIEIYERIGDDRGVWNVLSELGTVQRELSNYTEAGETLAKALDISTNLDDEPRRARVLHVLGEIRLSQARYSEAKGCVNEAIEILDRIEPGSAALLGSKELLAKIIKAEKSSTG